MGDSPSTQEDFLFALSNQVDTLCCMPDKLRICIVRFCYGGVEHAALGTWLGRTCHAIITNPRVSALNEFPLDRVPLYAARNYAVEIAQGWGATHLLFSDHDHHHDYDPAAPPFWETALGFASQHDGPCVVCAPARTGEPEYRVCVLREEERDGQKHLVSYSNDDAASMSGVSRVPSSGMSLALIDMRCFGSEDQASGIRPPYFRYEYTDSYQHTIKSDEGVLFTAECTQAGIPVYCAWDCWTMHRKMQGVGKPESVTPKIIL